MATETDLPETPPDVIPTIDQEEPVASYQDWRPEDTRVVVYTTDPDRYPKDRVAPDGVSAQVACENECGPILQVRTVPYRYFFRVRRGLY